MNDLKKIFTEIGVREYARLGFGFIMVALALWFFYDNYKRNEQRNVQHFQEMRTDINYLKDEIKECNATKLELLKEQIDKSNQHMERQTNDIRDIQKFMQRRERVSF